MVLFVVGLIIGGYIGYTIRREIFRNSDYDILIECDSEEDMRKVMRQLKDINECQEKEN